VTVRLEFELQRDLVLELQLNVSSKRNQLKPVLRTSAVEAGRLIGRPAPEE
jgi:hypothetical protein